MKTITCSNRIYYSELSSEEAEQALHQDIQLYSCHDATAYFVCLKSAGDSLSL